MEVFKTGSFHEMINVSQCFEVDGDRFKVTLDANDFYQALLKKAKEGHPLKTVNVCDIISFKMSSGTSSIRGSVRLK